MMNKLTAIAAALCLAACLDNPTTEDEVVEHERMLEVDTGSLDSTTKTDDPTPSTCSLVVDTDGPCAVACDAEALRAYIPDGACATFLCDLEDGSQWRTGGCNR